MLICCCCRLSYYFIPLSLTHQQQKYSGGGGRMEWNDRRSSSTQKHTHSPKMAIHGYPRLLSFTPFLLSNNSHTHPNYTAILDVRSLFSNIGALHFFAFIFQRFVLISPYFWGNTRVHLILTFKWMDFWGLLVITFACYCCHCSSSSPPPFPILSLSFVEFVFANKHKLP